MKKAPGKLILAGSLPRAILSIAVPVIINSFLQTTYNLVDTYWLGQVGKESLAAINLVTPVQSILVNFGGGLTVAAAVMIAQCVGAKRLDDAKSMLAHIFVCAMGLAVLFAAAALLFAPGIVAWLGADGDTLRYGTSYLRIVMMDIPFLFMLNLFQATRQAQGDTVRPLLLNLVGISINLILDPLMILTWGMGAAGAALATVIAKAVPGVIALVLLRHPRESIRLSIKGLRIEKEKLKTIAKIGLPTALGGSTMQLGFLLMSRTVFTYGVEAMAAYGIGNKVNGLISLPSNAIGSAVGTIVAQNFGANNPKRAERGYQLSMLGAVAFLLVGGLILSRKPISTAIVGIFSSDAQVVAMAADFLSIMAFWCWTNGIYNATSGLFQGTGHTEVTMAVDVTRLWVLRFATLYFCQTVLGLGVRSVWYSVVASNGISSAILLALYFSGLWKKPRIQLRKHAGQ